ncbi:hypothetical protein K458DRAFT_396013 [Lentithecium fluviatile CBS 122367]|uniref:Uncharacterized protein n=1 Tax=Lentithecium fluviatile CBS 122367 TaxID=1168545 RepID=A0A6G1IH54_9PLEO|nr:hypothetical protein K458DRAFT_396013 [Lentithecium fluviatile CBS 122367]
MPLNSFYDTHRTKSGSVDEGTTQHSVASCHRLLSTHFHLQPKLAKISHYSFRSYASVTHDNMFTDRASRLERHILTYSLTIIASFLVLLMVVWHISTTHLIDDYGMPEDWEQEFFKKQFAGGKATLWGMLFAVVLIDCMLALLALDYYHGCRYDRGKGENVPMPGAVKAEISKRNAKALESASPTSYNSNRRRRCSSINAPTSERTMTPTRPQPRPEILPATPPHTYHPLHSRRLRPSERFLVQTAYDALIMGLLATHIANFFASFPSNMRACHYRRKSLLAVTDPLHTKLTIEQRCYRINIDIHVAGGFDVALCAVLLALHMWHFGDRIYGVCKSTVDGALGSCVSSDDEDVVPAMRTIGRSLPNAQLMGFTGPQNARAFSTSVDEESKMAIDMGIKPRDWNIEKSGDREATSRVASGDSSAEGGWSEALLECLVP